MNDRRVHASYSFADCDCTERVHNTEIVRYERAGKWYVEPVDSQRRQISVRHAATLARWGVVRSDGLVHFGLPGGGTFDRLVRQLEAAA